MYLYMLYHNCETDFPRGHSISNLSTFKALSASSNSMKLKSDAMFDHEYQKLFQLVFFTVKMNQDLQFGTDISKTF